MTQSIRTLGELVTEDKIVEWLADQIGQNHRDADRGAAAVGTFHKLPMQCATCTAKKACCDSYVLIRLYEGLVIAAELERTGRDTPELRDQLRIRADTMDAASVPAWATSCLFLDANERCTVYSVRPTTCAQLHVYSPPELCVARSEQIISYTPRKEVEAANAIEEQFRERLSLRRKVGRRYFGTLPRMVLVSLEAWDRTDFRDYLRQLPWPTDEEWAARVRR